MKLHMKRMSAPRTWPIARKSRERWVAKPLPGAHKNELCISMSVAMREILKIANTTRDIKKIIHSGKVYVNGIRVRDSHFGVGLFDILFIEELGKAYRVVLTNKGLLHFVELKSDERNDLPLKVRTIQLLPGGKRQLSFTNGWNLLTDKKFVTGNTIMFDLKSKKLGEEINLEAGSAVVLISGSHIGNLAKVTEIITEGKLKKSKIAVLKAGKEDWKAPLSCLFAVGKDKPAFTAVVE